MPKGFWWGNLKKRNHLSDLGLEDRMRLKCNSDKYDEKPWNGYM
jgi:hypothetical protein